ncbi:hypothetical protein [Mesorhizobium sangaii]|uniref:Uncharacterized protein n=1 Tax=Mesorhizobium sangaii TaxID=505389 RepID=A0A841PCK5_9HYPH|nr:hypothetical protein [Mesorhizobium sangaii]MBB6411273.1 hypothetical protein [Mesorhizobium sangaii]
MPHDEIYGEFVGAFVENYSLLNYHLRTDENLLLEFGEGYIERGGSHAAALPAVERRPSFSAIGATTASFRPPISTVGMSPRRAAS